MSGEYVPARGDVVWINFNPQAGHEQAGRRSALILSPVEYNRKSGLVLLCPITTKIKGYPFEVSLPPESGASGVVLADQVKSLDWRARDVGFMNKPPMSVVEEVLKKVRALL